MTSQREGDLILFTHEGGVDVGDVNAKALTLQIPVGADFPTRETVAETLLKHVPAEKKDTLVDFLIRLYSVYVDLHYAYLEINPLICLDGVDGGQPTIHYLDMAAKLDQTAESICGSKWAIARDLSVYEPGLATTSAGGKVLADRGPPMVSIVTTTFAYNVLTTSPGLAGAVRSRPHQGGGVHPEARRLHGRVAQADGDEPRGPDLDDGRRWWCIRRVLGRDRRARVCGRARQLRRVLGCTNRGSDVRVREDHQ